MTNTANDRPQEWYDARADHLAEFLTDERRRTLAAALAERTRYMTLLAENTFHPHNASALMRHCDAFGVQELHTVETLCKFSPNASIVRGTDKWVDVRRHASTAEAIAALRAEGYRIVATTPHRESCTPETFDVARGPFALVFGTEHAGISDEAMAAADEYLRIPMCGLVESLNVSASAAILVYMLSQRVRSKVEGWRLPPLEAAALRLRWMRAAVRDAEGEEMLNSSIYLCFYAGIAYMHTDFLDYTLYKCFSARSVDIHLLYKVIVSIRHKIFHGKII